jgi:hypothetical protein
MTTTNEAVTAMTTPTTTVPTLPAEFRALSAAM